MQIYKTSKARENILSKIRKELGGNALSIPYPDVENIDEPIYVNEIEAAEEQFASVFTSLGGKFIYCENEQDLLDNINILYDTCSWKKLLCADERLLKLFQNNKIDILTPANPDIEDADACITGCEMLVARTGSILFSSKQHYGRTSSIYYPVHIVFAYCNQVVGDIDEGFAVLRKKYKGDMPSMISLTTGPSRTADIEKTLVVGVHGPCEIYCFYINAEG